MEKKKRKSKILVKVIKVVKKMNKGEHVKAHRFEQNKWKF